MKKDIFTGTSYYFLTFVLVGVFIIADVLTQDNVSNILWTAFFFIIGSLCIWNYKSCGRIHCQITGPGFLGVGAIALLNILGVINISWSIIWIIFWVILIVGYGIEFILRGKTGSCYKK